MLFSAVDFDTVMDACESKATPTISIIISYYLYIYINIYIYISLSLSMPCGPLHSARRNYVLYGLKIVPHSRTKKCVEVQ